MVAVSLRELLLTGRLGPVQLGASEEQIERLLGAPDDKGVTSRKHPRPRIWRYGSIELHFDQRMLRLIFADYFETLSGGSALELDPWVLSGQLSRSAAEQHLLEAHVPYQLRPYPIEPNTDEILTNSGVSLLFNGEDDMDAGERRLIVISCSLPLRK